MSAIGIGEQTRACAPGAWRVFLRAAAIISFVLLQLALIDRYYHYPWAVTAPDPLWSGANTALKWTCYAAIFGAAAFALLVLARAQETARMWLAAAQRRRWGRWLAGECALLAVLVAMLPIFRTPHEHAPWAAFAIWLGVGAAMLACAALALAPFSFWRTFLARNTSAYVVALLTGGLTFAALPLSQNSWDALSSATLHASYFILSLFDDAAFVDPAARHLGAGDFVVRIDAACSGYEGIALVLAMFSLYIFAFRKDLRFPHVFLLLPLAVAAIWISNALRIAALIGVGAYISPEIALDGFHAQAGWVMFLAVTLSLMAATHQIAWFRAERAPARPVNDPALVLAGALLAPFVALMGARIAGGMFGPEAYWIGAAAILAPAGVIWACWGRIKPLLGGLTLEPILIGLMVGALWIATEPAIEGDALGAWLAGSPPGEAAAWVALRLFGFVLIVPLAEELVFRGYLHRALVKRRFEHAAPAAFGWAAFLVTSLLFGAMHGRWLAGALAGAAFAVTLYRTRSLTGPIAAHVAANGLIGAYAVATETWALL